MMDFDEAIRWSRNMIDEAEAGALSMAPDLAACAAEASADFTAALTAAWWQSQPFDQPDGFSLVRVAEGLMARVLASGSSEVSEFERVLLQCIEFSQNMTRAYGALGESFGTPNEAPA